MANALQELVKSRLEQQGWSYGDVARRGGIPRSTVHHLATVTHVARMPQQATLEGRRPGEGPVRARGVPAAGRGRGGS
ncbi:hypothetical protein ABZT43_40060, partial [Streptomyces sp. NPDC005349]